MKKLLAHHWPPVLTLAFLILTLLCNGMMLYIGEGVFSTFFSLTAAFTLYYYPVFFVLRVISEVPRPLLSFGIASVIFILIPFVIFSFDDSPTRYASRVANPLAVILPLPPPTESISNYLDNMLSSRRGGMLSSGCGNHLSAISSNRDFRVIPEAGAFQSSGKILVLAEVQRRDTPDNYKRHKVDRLNADGTTDSTFNGGQTCLTFDSDISLPSTRLVVHADDSFSLVIFGGVENQKILSRHFDKDGRPIDHPGNAFFIENFSWANSWVYHINTANNGTDWNTPDRKRVDFSSVQMNYGLAGVAEEYPERIVRDGEGFIGFYELPDSRPRHEKTVQRLLTEREERVAHYTYRDEKSETRWRESIKKAYFLGIAYFDADGKKIRFDELRNLGTAEIPDLNLRPMFSSKMAIQKQEGKLFFVTASASEEHYGEINFMRFDESGNLDTAYAENAHISLKETQITTVNALDSRSDGSVLVVGYGQNSRSPVILLRSDGAIDPNFQSFTVIP